MARPKRKRMVCWEPDYIHFQPDGISPSEQIILSVDEYEVIRLVDFEKKTHEETARQMQISRTTVTEIYESARQAIAHCGRAVSAVSKKWLLPERLVQSTAANTGSTASERETNNENRSNV